MRIAWHLAEIFYWAVAPSDAGTAIIAPQVIDWAKSSLDPMLIDDPNPPLSPAYFWSYVQRLLLRGEISQVINILNESNYSDAHTIAALLHKMPSLYSIQGINTL